MPDNYISFYSQKKLKHWQELQVEVLTPQRLTYPFRLSASRTNLFGPPYVSYT